MKIIELYKDLSTGAFYKDGEGLDEHSTAVVYAVVVNGHHFLLGEVGKDDVVVQDV